jgi:hypothetical protein
MSAPSGGVVVLRREDPVPPAGIEAAFSGLWRRASEQFGGPGTRGVVRACLWNLVVHLPAAAAAAGQASRLDALLGAVTPVVPARVIRLRQSSERDSPGAEVQAWVSSSCLPSPDGGGTVCAEEATLAAFGEAGASHLPALVRALRIPDIPVALLWLDELPPKGRLLSQLTALSDRLVVDSHFMEGEHDLPALSELARNPACPVVDLGWMRLGPMRYLVAKLFDPPGHAEKLARLESVRVETTPDGVHEGVLLLGWLLSRCGCREFGALPDATPGRGARWRVRLGGASFPVELAVREGFGGFDYDGILGIEIAAAGERYAIAQVDEEHVSVASSHHRQQRVALHGWRDAELVVSALRSGVEDALHGEALSAAVGLMKSEAWSP